MDGARESNISDHESQPKSTRLQNDFVREFLFIFQNEIKKGTMPSEIDAEEILEQYTAFFEKYKPDFDFTFYLGKHENALDAEKFFSFCVDKAPDIVLYEGMSDSRGQIQVAEIAHDAVTADAEDNFKFPDFMNKFKELALESSIPLVNMDIDRIDPLSDLSHVQMDTGYGYTIWANVNTDSYEDFMRTLSEREIISRIGQDRRENIILMDIITTLLAGVVKLGNPVESIKKLVTKSKNGEPLRIVIFFGGLHNGLPRKLAEYHRQERVHVAKQDLDEDSPADRKFLEIYWRARGLDRATSEVDDDQGVDPFDKRYNLDVKYPIGKLPIEELSKYPGIANPDYSSVDVSYTKLPKEFWYYNAAMYLSDEMLDAHRSNSAVEQGKVLAVIMEQEPDLEAYLKRAYNQAKQWYGTKD